MIQNLETVNIIIDPKGNIQIKCGEDAIIIKKFLKLT